MKIAVLPGDGIGPEIVREARKVLDALRRDGIAIEVEEAPIGGAGYDAAKHPLPASTLALAQQADAVLLGAVGGPQYDTLPRELRPEQGILGIRKALNDPSRDAWLTGEFLVVTLVATLVSAVVGYLTITPLIRLVQRCQLWWFAVYVWCVGLAVLFFKEPIKETLERVLPQ